MKNIIIHQLKLKERKALREQLERLKANYQKQNENLTALFLLPNIKSIKTIELFNSGKISSVQFTKLIGKQSKRRKEIFQKFNIK